MITAAAALSRGVAIAKLSLKLGRICDTTYFVIYVIILFSSYTIIIRYFSPTERGEKKLIFARTQRNRKIFLEPLKLLPI